MASSRQSRSHAPRARPVASMPVIGPLSPASGPQTRSKISRNTVRPNRFRAWVIALAVGTLHEAFQQPHRSSDPVTLVATSV